MATSIGSQIRGYAGKASDSLTLVTQGLGLESKTVKPNQPRPIPAFNYVQPKSPEETSGVSTRDPKFISFPSDIDNVSYFITFTFSEKNYHNANFAQVEGNDITYRIRLPMPSTLIDSFKTNYQGTSLGTLFGYGLQTGIPNDIYRILTESTINESQAKLKIIVDNARNRAAQAKEDFSGPDSVALSAIRYALSNVSQDTARAVDYITGTTLNPFQSLFFEGTELRSHNFSFKLSPNSFEESVKLRRIVNIFKTRMLPTSAGQGLLLKYPDSCIIELSTRVDSYSLYTMYRSVLSGISVNYAPNNVPVFFKNGFEPVEVALDLNFSEVRPVTREDVVKTLSNKEQLL
jgi:hypothetical protein